MPIASPAGFWYDQDEDEWVVVLRGTATLEFAGGEQVELKAGDYLTIAPPCAASRRPH